MTYQNINFNNTLLAVLNKTSTNEDILEDQKWLEPQKYLVPILFSIIFITGFIGNGTLIIIFFRHRSMRSIPNTYILSLAIGDLLVVSVSVPFVSTIYTFESWPFGSVICKVSEFFRDVSSAVTIYTLVALSIERYTVVVNNIRASTSGTKRASTIITTLLIWLVAIVMSIPSVIFSDSVDFLAEKNDTNASLIICYPFPIDRWPWYPKAITMIRFIFLYIIPLIIIAPFYITLSKYLLITTQHVFVENGQVRNSVSSQMTLGHSKQLKARKKIAVLVLAMFFLFLISFLPNHIFMIWFYYNSNSVNDYNDFWHYFRMIGFILMFANSCMNPIALYCLSAVFRRHFNHYIFHCCSKRNRMTNCQDRTLQGAISSNHSRFHFNFNIQCQNKKEETQRYRCDCQTNNKFIRSINLTTSSNLACL